MLHRTVLVLILLAGRCHNNVAWSLARIMMAPRSSRDLAASTLPDAPQPTIAPPNAVEPGHLYYVSTPLGNLQDVTLRALHILAGVDVILAEDTRTTLKLLSLLRIAPKRVLAHHEHNWQQSTPGVVQMLREGRSVALVSDAGTPGVSDPGSQLAAACAAEGLPIHPIPGPSAVLAAVSVCGFNCVPFTFHGFVPAKGRERGEVLLALLQARGVGVFFEAPHRVSATMRALAALTPEWGERRCVVCRELTKRNEEVWRGSITDAATWLEGCAERGSGAGGEGADGAGAGAEGGGRLLRRAAIKGSIRGEFTIVVGPREETPQAPLSASASAPASDFGAAFSGPPVAESRSQTDVRSLLSKLRADGVSRSEAVAVVAATLQGQGQGAGAGASRGVRREVYKIALGMAWEAMEQE